MIFFFLWWLLDILNIQIEAMDLAMDNYLISSFESPTERLNRIYSKCQNVFPEDKHCDYGQYVELE